MARSFADQHVLCTEAAETLGRSGDQERMRVYVVSGDVIDEVGFEEDSLPTNVQVKKLQPGMQNAIQVVRIGFGPENRHAGARLPPSYLVLRTVQQGGSGGAGSQAERGPLHRHGERAEIRRRRRCRRSILPPGKFGRTTFLRRAGYEAVLGPVVKCHGSASRRGLNRPSEPPNWPSLGSRASQTCRDQSGRDGRWFGTSISIANVTPTHGTLKASGRLGCSLSLGYDGGSEQR